MFDIMFFIKGQQIKLIGFKELVQLPAYSPFRKRGQLLSCIRKAGFPAHQFEIRQPDLMGHKDEDLRSELINFCHSPG
ncbi:hypothetical protein D3C72_898040 [compost metagenome]